MELPEIHDAERLHLGPDDVLVVRNSEAEIDRDQAVEIERAVRVHLGRPDLKVIALGRDWTVQVVAPDKAPVNWANVQAEGTEFRSKIDDDVKKAVHAVARGSLRNPEREA